MVPLNISTMAIARITKLPFIGKPTEMPLKGLELSVTAIPIPEPKPDVVPLWVVVLSACAGVIILLLIIYLLYKVSVIDIKIYILIRFIICTMPHMRSIK